MYLPDDLHDFLVEESARRGVSMAEIAREAIGSYRTGCQAPPKRNYEAIIGVLDDDGRETNLSERVDEILADHYRKGGTWDQEHGFADPD